MNSSKYFLLYSFVFALTFGCSNKAIQALRGPTDAAVRKFSAPAEIFKDFWQTSKANIYPKELEQRYFTQDEFAQLSQAAQASADVYEFSSSVNSFLKKLKVSHTHFYTDHDLEFYFFRSLFSTRNPDLPAIEHIGAEYEFTNTGYVIRSVLDGFGAQKSGLRRGDRPLEVNGKPFDAVTSFRNIENDEAKITIQRGTKVFQLQVKPSFTGLHRAYIESIKNSVKVLNVKNKKIGYVHLWTGTHDDSIKELQNSVNQLKNTDALILDLRDGYGGAWWDHLDPFFQNTQNYFKATWVDRDGKTTDMIPESKANLHSYTKPMVVLINEGVRSGKEALAFQFKKTKRATLVGTKTAGFFVGGGAYFREIELPYFLYLSTKGLLLDGVDLEGNGVTPDIYIEYPLASKLTGDPQLKKAFKLLTK
jgi:carboxyl-terminal processing protease